MESARYEWDELKRVRNREKHGVDFSAATRFDWSQAVVVIDKRRLYGEERRTAYGPIDGRLYALVYTLRGDRRRIISFRKANRREQATYTAGAPG